MNIWVVSIHILTSVNNVTMSLGVQMSFQYPDFILFNIYLELELLGLRAAIHGVAKCQTRLSDWTELNGQN